MFEPAPLGFATLAVTIGTVPIGNASAKTTATAVDVVRDRLLAALNHTIRIPIRKFRRERRRHGSGLDRVTDDRFHAAEGSLRTRERTAFVQEYVFRSGFAPNAARHLAETEVRQRREVRQEILLRFVMRREFATGPKTPA
jgi:hypothetical protein